MTYTNAIKSGFSLINKKWQLVAVQAGLMAINCIGFFIIVGIPIGIALIIFGLDISRLAETKDILGIFNNLPELLSRFLGLFLIIIASFLLYITVASTLWLYVFGGSVGVIGRTLSEPSLKFSMRTFFTEARKIFFPLIWFSLLIGLVFIAIAFVLGLFGVGITVIVSSAKTQDSTLALFLGIFFSLVLALAALSIILSAFAVTTYGIAVLFFKGEGAIKSLKGAVKFLWNNQHAFWLYLLLVIGYLSASFILLFITYPLRTIPFAGVLLVFPIQILSYVAQSYLGLVVIAVTFIYYFETDVKKAETAEPAQDLVES